MERVIGKLQTRMQANLTLKGLSRQGVHPGRPAVRELAHALASADGQACPTCLGFCQRRGPDRSGCLAGLNGGCDWHRPQDSPATISQSSYWPILNRYRTMRLADAQIARAGATVVSWRVSVRVPADHVSSVAEGLSCEPDHPASAA